MSGAPATTVVRDAGAPRPSFVRAIGQAAVRLPVSFWRHRDIIRQLTRRELAARYRGSVLGMAWSLVTPALMLGVYTYLFGIVLRARWNTTAPEGRLDFALILFVGLTVYNLFAECIVRAPMLVVGNAHLVKRVIFPIEVLPWPVMGTGLIHLGLNLAVWGAAATLAGHAPGLTAVWLPVVLLPLVLFTMGGMWLLATLGVYLRDTSHVVGVVTTILLFLSPVFYRVDTVPEPLQSAVRLSPLTFVIEQARQVLVWHQTPTLRGLSIAIAGGAAAAILGLACFQRARRGFADVL